MIDFFKYQATGNDFVMIDNRQGQVAPTDYTLFERLCHRRFGIGADGVILLQTHREADFEMLYYNADGRPGSMCGNGGRATVRFAQALGIAQAHTRFLAVDGPHEADLLPDLIWLKMGSISPIEDIGPQAWYLNTGSPHYVQWLDHGLDELDVYQAGRAVRYNDRFRTEGTNVNYVQTLAPGLLQVRTYERGVEDETYSCGTGVTAAAWVYRHRIGYTDGPIRLRTLGGELQVDFRTDGVWLGGPAVCVFSGRWID